MISYISYFSSLIIAIFSLIMTIKLMFSTVIDKIPLKFFGDKELYICIAVSIMLMIIGVQFDKKENIINE